MLSRPLAFPPFGPMSPASRARLPFASDQLAAFVGYGNWAGASGNAIWLLDESATPLQPSSGSPSLAATGSPVYGGAGPAGIGDRSIYMGADGNATLFSTPTAFGIGASDDYLFLQVFKVRTLPASTRYGAGRGGTPGVQYPYYPSGSTGIGYYCGDGTNVAAPAPAGVYALNVWEVAIMGLERGASTNGRVFIGSTRVLSLADVSPGVLGAVTSTNVWTLNAGPGSGGPDMDMAYAAVSVGTNAAAGVSAQVQNGCQNFKTRVAF